MENVKKERIEESRKKTKHLFILLILTAILLITSTYAWFSVQRDVEMSGVNVNVGVTDNMQISLDGESWSQKIEIKDMNQLLGTYEPEDDGVYYQAKKGLHTNYVPEEMKPVSTIGTVKSGEIQFVYGTIEGKTLKNITKCTEEDLKFDTEDGNGTRTENNADHPYLVFDMYIRNMSTSEDTDVLQLNKGSEVKISKNGINSTGLENSVRVGFVAYNDNAKLINDNGETIRSAEGTDNDKVAIWEPNARSHVDAIVANDSRITSNLQDFETYGVKETAEEVADITDYEGDTQNLADVKTVKAEQKEAVDVQLTPTTKVTNLKDIEGNDFTIKANRVTKIRVYIWLEGQDPDCVDIASQGKEIEATIKLTRGEKQEEVESVLENFKNHPEKYPKPNEQTEVADVGIAEDGTVLNMDLWSYKIIDEENNYFEICGESYGCDGGIPAFTIKRKNEGYDGITIVEDNEKKIASFTGGMPTYLRRGDKIYKLHKIGLNAFYTFGNSICDEFKFEIPSTVEIIGDHAFEYCEGLIEIEIPMGVTTINNDAFSCCENLLAVDVPDSVTYLGNEALAGCDNLKTVRIGRGVTVIRAFMFALDRKLETVRFEGNLTDIENSIFRNCLSIKTVYYRGTREDWDRINIGSDNDNLKSVDVICENKTGE